MPVKKRLKGRGRIINRAKKLGKRIAKIGLGGLLAYLAYIHRPRRRSSGNAPAENLGDYDRLERAFEGRGRTHKKRRIRRRR